MPSSFSATRTTPRPGTRTRITEPGRYRAELWLDIVGEQQIWILTNPFYVTGDAK